MTIKDHTYRIKIRHFVIILTCSFIGVLFYKYRINEFPISLLDLTFIDWFMPVFTASLSGYNVGQVKIVICDFGNADELLKWINNYFIKHKAKLIHKSNHDLIYEVLDGKKWFFKNKKTYYQVLLTNQKAIIQGPKNRNPNH